jgi:hypothetical protein
MLAIYGMEQAQQERKQHDLNRVKNLHNWVCRVVYILHIFALNQQTIDTSDRPML